jgi:hypothetical protein
MDTQNKKNISQTNENQNLGGVSSQVGAGLPEAGDFHGSQVIDSSHVPSTSGYGLIGGPGVNLPQEKDQNLNQNQSTQNQNQNPHIKG